MTDCCTALDLYDPASSGLSDWANQLWQSTEQTPQEMLAEVEDPRDRFETFCDRYGVTDADALQRQYVSLVEYVRDEADIPGRCPHEPVAGADRCPFHLPPDEYEDHDLDSEAVTDEFVSRVHAYSTDPTKSSTIRNKCFVRARFAELDLRYRSIDSADKFPIDLRFAEVSSLAFDNSRVEDGLHFTNATIGALSATEADFELALDCRNVQFGPGPVTFDGAQFGGGHVDFTNCRFECERVSFERTGFTGADLSFDRATFDPPSDDGGPGDVSFSRMSVENADVSFNAARFADTTLGIAVTGDVQAGADVTVEVHHDLRPLAGASLFLVSPSGNKKPLGRTASDGTHTFTVPDSGIDPAAFRIEARFEGLDGTAPLEADQTIDKYGGTSTVSFDRFVHVGGDLVFKNATMYCPVQFRYASVGSQLAEFTRATFFDRADFRKTSFDCEDLDFRGSQFFGRDLDLSSARFNGGSVDFTSTQIQTRACDFSGARFDNGDVNLEAERIEAETISFDGITFACDDVRFDETRFSAERVSFDDCNLYCEDISFTDCTFEAATVAFTNVDSRADNILFRRTISASPIDCENSTINLGELTQPADDRTQYSLDNATVGDVTLGGTGTERLFDCYRFRKTEYDGFNFGEHKEELSESEWNIHPGLERYDEQSLYENRSITDNLRSTLSLYARLAREGSRSDPNPAPGTLETTYMRAKNGADDVGDSKATAEFFQKELFYRRKKHGQQVWDRSLGGYRRFRASRRWLYNFLLGSITGYGEKPRRVLLSSLVTILLFIGIFEGLWALTDATPAPGYKGLIGSSILSLESFTTLVLGGGNVGPTPVRLFGYIEGFIGAFLIALFVFTLTRSIRR